MLESTWAPLAAATRPREASISPSMAPPASPKGAVRLAFSTAGAARFRGMVDSHFNFVWRYLRGLGVPEASVDDAAQHVFVVAAEKLDAIADGRERSFLVGTALGVAANARR